MVCVTPFFAIMPFFREDIHGVDSMCVSLSDLKDFAEGSAANEPENVSKLRENFWRWRLFVGYLQLEAT